MSERLRDKVALITGSDSGIGQATAIEFANGQPAPSGASSRPPARLTPRASAAAGWSPPWRPTVRHRLTSTGAQEPRNSGDVYPDGKGFIGEVGTDVPGSVRRRLAKNRPGQDTPADRTEETNRLLYMPDKRHYLA